MLLTRLIYYVPIDLYTSNTLKKLFGIVKKISVGNHKCLLV